MNLPHLKLKFQAVAEKFANNFRDYGTFLPHLVQHVLQVTNHVL